MQASLSKSDEIVSQKQTQIDNLEKTIQELKQETENISKLRKELEEVQHAADLYSEEMNQLRQDNAEKQSTLFQKL